MNLLLDFNGRRLQGARPFAVFEAKGDTWTYRPSSTGLPFREGHNGAWDALRATFAQTQEGYPDGAALGYFSYDFARTLEPRAFPAATIPQDQPIPDVRLVFFEELQDVPQARQNPHNSISTAAKMQDVDSEYVQAIQTIQRYIAQGDIYQANYARRFESAMPCPALELYEQLTTVNPAPFSALLEWDDFAIVSNSPERFLKLQNGHIMAQPIKGTAPRGKNALEDAALKATLQASEKDRAENVMIVDLLRNDFGRVCRYGSVQVPQLFEVQTFPTLHHLVSTVTGELRSDCNALDAFAATFPCGSITGAPKIRAMQIIDELESTRRGASFGAIGYFAFNGDMEWNVAIRTLTCKDGIASFHAGGGIVEGSEATSEYREMQLKALALQRALNSSAHKRQ
jgi:aminodeoxychorismate synthase component I